MTRIIIAEDEKIVAKDIENKLKKSGYDVVAVVSTGKDLLDKVYEYKPDLVLMDIKLDGEMDGIETAAKLKNCYELPVVYLTAYADKITLKRIDETKPGGYVLKPFKLSDLRESIEAALLKSSRIILGYYISFPKQRSFVSRYQER